MTLRFLDDIDGGGGGVTTGGGPSGMPRHRQHPHMDYDKDDLDDFIDLGDDIKRDVGGGLGEGGVSESMLQEHLDIFGTDNVEFMGDDNGDNGRIDMIGDDDDILDDFEHKKKQRRKYRECRVGVDYGIDSGKEVEDDSDIDDNNEADLFGKDNIDQDIGDKQHAEVLRLKR
jgi:hypothetical protein